MKPAILRPGTRFTFINGSGKPCQRGIVVTREYARKFFGKLQFSELEHSFKHDLKDRVWVLWDNKTCSIPLVNRLAILPSQELANEV